MEPTSALTAAGEAELAVVDQLCGEDVLAHFADADPDELLEPIGAAEAWTSLLTANNPGQVRSDAPILMIHGTNDFLPVDAVVRLHEQMCTIGQQIELRLIARGDHETSGLPALVDGASWIFERLQDREPASTCGRPQPSATETRFGTPPPPSHVLLTPSPRLHAC